MHEHDMDGWRHSHDFGGHSGRAETSTRRVIALTAVMMVIEIVAGTASGSMALLADGWHMATHVAAFGITLFAYRYARIHATNPRYSYGTGKVGVLGGFASAVALAMVALMTMTMTMVTTTTTCARPTSTCSPMRSPRCSRSWRCSQASTWAGRGWTPWSGSSARS